MHFEIRIDMPKGSYRLQVERTHAGDSLEKFRVTGGNRSIVVQSDRPIRLTTKSKKKITWKILEAPRTGPESIEQKTYAIYKIMQEIELYVKKVEPTLREYLEGRNALVN